MKSIIASSRLATWLSTPSLGFRSAPCSHAATSLLSVRYATSSSAQHVDVSPLPPLDSARDVLSLCECISVCIDTIPSTKVKNAATLFLTTPAAQKRYLEASIDRLEYLALTSEGMKEEELDSFDSFCATAFSLRCAVERSRRPRHDDRAYLLNPRASAGTTSQSSPYVSNDLADMLGAWMDRCIARATPSLSKRPYAETLELLETCAFLHIGGDSALREIGNTVTSTQVLRSMTLADVVRALDAISLITKRMGIVFTRGISNILVNIGSKELSSEQTLIVLSSLVRTREERQLEIVRQLTRRGMSHVAGYTPQEIVFGLRAATLLRNVHEGYVLHLLGTAASKVILMGPSTLGTLCHLLEMMKGSKRSSHFLTGPAQRELNKLLPVILEQTKKHLGKFTLRDARYIMRCLTVFKMRHAVVFAELTNLITEG